MPKVKSETSRNERLVILVEPQFKADYLAMCVAIGEPNFSTHIREGLLEPELALYNQSKDEKDGPL